MDDFTALRVSGDELLRRLVAVTPQDMQRPSTCDGWSVYDLANHVLGGARRYLLQLQEADLATVQATREQDFVGDDPVTSFTTLAEPLERAFTQPGVLDRTFQHPAGERTGRQLLRMRITDQSLHAVDLSRSLGLDERLDPLLVDYLLLRCAPMFEAGRAAGFFAPARSVGDSADPQERLLALSGR